MEKPPELDLFGQPIFEPEPFLHGKRQTKPHGYAANPGTGPRGETCKTCKYYARIRYSKVYRKCAKVYDRWTHGCATDILAGAPACHYWEEREKQGKNTS